MGIENLLLFIGGDLLFTDQKSSVFPVGMRVQCSFPIGMGRISGFFFFLTRTIF